MRLLTMTTMLLLATTTATLAIAGTANAITTQNQTVNCTGQYLEHDYPHSEGWDCYGYSSTARCVGDAGWNEATGDYCTGVHY